MRCAEALGEYEPTVRRPLALSHEDEAIEDLPHEFVGLKPAHRRLDASLRLCPAGNNQAIHPLVRISRCSGTDASQSLSPQRLPLALQFVAYPAEATSIHGLWFVAHRARASCSSSFEFLCPRIGPPSFELTARSCAASSPFAADVMDRGIRIRDGTSAAAIGTA